VSLQPRLAQLIYDYSFASGGGITRHSLLLAGALHANGFQVTQLGLYDSGHTDSNPALAALHRQGVPSLALAPADPAHPYRAFRQAIGELTRFLRAHPHDILHSHSEFGDLALLACRAMGVPGRLVRTVHYGYRHEWRKRPERRLLFSNLLIPLTFTREIGVSPAVTQALDRRPLARLLHKRARFIPPVTDLAPLSRQGRTPDLVRQARQRMGLPEGAPLFGSVGRLTEQKGFRYLVDAAPLVLAHLARAHFVIIGAGELEADLRRQVHALGLDRRVHLLGSRQDVAACLPGLDVFVSSSLWEGLPLVVMEAMAACLPVVATDIPGSRELVRPGETGWLAPPADAPALGLALLEAWHAPAASQAMAGRAQAEVIAAYSLEAVAHAYADLYAAI
jgi:glycosyltransferase involved in cell wall biosynthesis